MLTSVYESPDLNVYKIDNQKNILVNSYLVTSAGTREICNDPQICGIEFTKKMEKLCSSVLSIIPDINEYALMEEKGVVIDILRSGLTFGMRQALSQGLNWNIHQTSFIEAIKKEGMIETQKNRWYIESGYQQFNFPDKIQLFIGDKIVSGKTLEYVLNGVLKETVRLNKQIESLILFTVGSDNAEKVCIDFAESCKKNFKSFVGIDIYYIEGVFNITERNQDDKLHKEGYDLWKKDALLAPEYINSQYELPFYPIERCVMYDLSMRAYDLPHYIEDVTAYWEMVKEQASDGLTFEDLIKESFPEIDASKFGKQNLMSLAEQHIIKLKRTLISKEKE